MYEEKIFCGAAIHIVIILPGHLIEHRKRIKHNIFLKSLVNIYKILCGYFFSTLYALVYIIPKVSLFVRTIQ